MRQPYTGKLSPENQTRLAKARQSEPELSVRALAKALDLPYGQVRGYFEWKDSQYDLLEPPHSPKMLVFDIENAPMLGWVWDLWQTNVIDVEQEWYLLSFAYAWYDLRTDTIGPVDFVSIFQDPDFEPDQADDSYVVKRLWTLMDEADIVIGQNSKAFDVKKVNARFIINGMRPPQPFQQVDTKTAAADVAKFGSNSLKHLARQLGITLKETNRGFDLWRECMAGDEQAWREMESYNKTDVVATAELYTRLRPWMTSRQHPNLGLYIADEGMVCTNCGNKEKGSGGEGFQHRGYHRTNASKFPQVQCNRCGKYSRKYQRVPQRSRETRTDLR